MYSFFVLGIVPGTNIQITFVMWLEATTAVFLLAFVVRSVWKRRHATIVMPPTISSELEYDYTETTVLAQ